MVKTCKTTVQYHDQGTDRVHLRQAASSMLASSAQGLWALGRSQETRAALRPGPVPTQRLDKEAASGRRQAQEQGGDEAQRRSLPGKARRRSRHPVSSAEWLATAPLSSEYKVPFGSLSGLAIVPLQLLSMSFLETLCHSFKTSRPNLTQGSGPRSHLHLELARTPLF